MDKNIISDINNLSNYERTKLLSFFIAKYNLKGRICCCYYCETIGSEIYGRGVESCDFFICEYCKKDYCSKCVSLLDDYDYRCKDCKNIELDKTSVNIL